MTTPRLPRPSAPRMRRVVHVAPSAFTWANLFFGIWSIVSSSRGQLRLGRLFIILAGTLDGSTGAWPGCRRPARGSGPNSIPC